MENKTQGISVPDEPTEIEVPQEQVMAIIAQIEKYYSGPLPSPELLARFERLLPGTAERIIKEFELNSEHSRSMEKCTIESSVKYAERGQYRGFVVSILGMVIGAATVLLGIFFGSNSATVATSIAGTALSGISILGLVGKFIDGPRKTDGSEDKRL